MEKKIEPEKTQPIYQDIEACISPTNLSKKPDHTDPDRDSPFSLVPKFLSNSKVKPQSPPTAPKTGTPGWVASSLSEHSSFDAEYQKRTLTLWGVIVLVLLSIEVVVWHVSYQVTHLDPLGEVKHAGSQLLAVYANVTTAKAALTTQPTPMSQAAYLKAMGALLREMVTFNTHVAKAEENGWAVFKIQIIPTAISAMFLVILFLVVIYNRHERSVRSRGLPYVLQLSISAFLLLAALSLTTCNYLLVFYKLPQVKDVDSFTAFSNMATVIQNVSLTLSVLNFTILSCYLSAIVQRLRVIYLIFARTVKTRRVNYLTPFPSAFVIGLSATSTVFVWRYVYSYAPEQEYLGMSGLWFIMLVYVLWMAYYILHTKNAASEFSDYYLNIRILLLVIFTIGPNLIYISLRPENLNVGWWALARFSLTVAACDQFICQWVQHRYRYERAGKQTTQSVRALSHTVNGPPGQVTRSNVMLAPSMQHSTI